MAIGQPDLPTGVYASALDTSNARQRLLDGIKLLGNGGRGASFMEGASVLAQPFDVARAALSRVRRSRSRRPWASGPGTQAIGWFGVSAGGTLAPYCLTGQTTSSRNSQLTWLDRKGGPVGTIGAPGDYQQIVLSPDARNLAVEIRGAEERLRPLGHGRLARGAEPRRRRAG